jgi:hypothetical protein
MEMATAAFILALAIWFFAVWRSYEERRHHPPRQ